MSKIWGANSSFTLQKLHSPREITSGSINRTKPLTDTPTQPIHAPR